MACDQHPTLAYARATHTRERDTCPSAPLPRSPPTRGGTRCTRAPGRSSGRSSRPSPGPRRPRLRRRRRRSRPRRRRRRPQSTSLRPTRPRSRASSTSPTRSSSTGQSRLALPGDTPGVFWRADKSHYQVQVTDRLASLEQGKQIVFGRKFCFKTKEEALEKHAELSEQERLKYWSAMVEQGARQRAHA